jgi:RimJ/RimL family protein N-acetyltransferase
LLNPLHLDIMTDIQPQIITDRLIIRPTNIDDYDDCCKLMGDADVMKYIGGEIVDPEHVWLKILHRKGHWDYFGYGCFTIRDKVTNEFYGEIGISHFKRPIAAPYSPQFVEASWTMAPSAQGKGIGKEALYGLVEWDEKHNITKSDWLAIIEPPNKRSSGLAQKVGFELAAENTKWNDITINLWVRKNPNKNKFESAAVAKL